MGESRSGTTLYFPKTLTELSPRPYNDTVSHYAWAGGYIRFSGTFSDNILGDISQDAERGDKKIFVSDTSGFSIGQEIRLHQRGLELTRYLAGPQPESEGEPRRTEHWNQLLLVVHVGSNYIVVDRPIRFPIRLNEWATTLYDFNPTVREGGIRNLRFEFPNTPYEWHHAALGYNAIAIGAASDIVIENIEIHNADSGILGTGLHSEVRDVIFTADREGG